MGILTRIDEKIISKISWNTCIQLENDALLVVMQLYKVLIPIMIVLWLITLPLFSTIIDSTRQDPFLYIIIYCGYLGYIFYLIIVLLNFYPSNLKGSLRLSSHDPLQVFINQILNVIGACIFSIYVTGSLIASNTSEMLVSIAIIITNFCVAIAVILFFMSIYYVAKRMFYEDT